MRRLFVLWLVLLFPLNVMALSISVATFQHADATGHAHRVSASGSAALDAGDSLLSQLFDTPAGGDLDSDEPPAVADLHDQVYEEDLVPLILLPASSRAAGVPLRQAQSAFPPLKPPPTV